MSRPETHDDLSDWQRQGHHVATIPSEFITRFPSLGQHLLAAVAEADRLGLVRDDDGSIRIPFTTEELDDRLRREQASWDHTRERYLNPQDCPTYFRTTVSMWADREGFAAVDWDAVDAQAVV